MDKNYLIKDVAMYLRKSRGDAETDLDKHRLALTELCAKLQCRYKEYAEIGTSDSIQDRPKFTELLDDIQQGLYDAIVVMDIDRLGRGDDQDWGKIEKILRENEVLIVTTGNIYDLENDEDEFQLDVKKFFARLEYKQITKRLRRGKILGAKKGKWTNGKPPYPYVYNKDTQSLEVDIEKKKVYRYILDRALQGYSAEEISWELNKLGHKSPGNKLWSSTAVYRTLCDKTHMGKIIFNKQKGSGHINKKTKPLKKFEKEDWIVIDGEHEILKTEDEHNKIIELFSKRKIIPKAARRGAFTLSGLVHCGKCGYSMQFTFNGVNKIEYVKKCQKTDPYGVRCGNSGVNTKILIDTIFKELEEQEDELKNKRYNVSERELEILRGSINEKKNDILKEERALDTLQEQRENQEITKDRFVQRSEIRQDNINRLKKEVSELEERCSRREQTTNEKRLKTIHEFYNIWKNTDLVKEKNTILKTIVDNVSYIRDVDDVSININFL